MKCWHRYPDEEPEKTDYYLLRGKGGITDKVYHYIGFWVASKDCESDMGIGNKFYVNGNEFKTKDDTFEWMDLGDLPKE